MNKKSILSVAALAVAACLSGCATYVVETAHTPSTSPSASKIQAVGYGAMGGHNSQYTLGQQKLLAMRAARVDAYRNLAEQVNGFRISGSTTVSAFVTQNDSMRTYVDAYLTGARLVGVVPIADGNFEATVELDLSPTFISCVSGRVAASACAAPTRRFETACAAGACVQPAGYYTSHP